MKKGRKARQKRYRKLLETKFKVRGKSRFIDESDSSDKDLKPLEVVLCVRHDLEMDLYYLVYKGVYVGYRQVVKHPKRADKIKDKLEDLYTLKESANA